MSLIYEPIKTKLLTFSAVTVASIAIEALIRRSWRWLSRRRRVSDDIDASSPIQKTCSIIIERVYDNIENDYADALLDYLTEYDGVRFIEYHRFFMVAHKEDVRLCKYEEGTIYARIHNYEMDADKGVVKKIKFEIYSYDLKLSVLRRFMSSCAENYRIKKK